METEKGEEGTGSTSIREARFLNKTKSNDTMTQRLIKSTTVLLIGMAVLIGCREPVPEPSTPDESTAPMEPIAREDTTNGFTSETIHVGVVVSDLEASLQFYQEAIGMQRVSSFDIDEDFGQRSGLSNGVPFSVEVLQLGTGPTATQWKLMTFGDRAAPQENDYIYDHTGMQYITINVDDLDDAIARLEAHNVEMLGETPTPLSGGRSFVLVQDPDGTFVELIGPMGER